LLQIAQLGLKRLYKYPPKRSHEESAEKHKTTKQRLFQQKIGGGNAVGVAPGRFSNITNTAIMMKRE
jgi:hypothetical protein